MKRGQKKLRSFGPFSLSLPPAEQEVLAAWLKYAAAQMGNHLPPLAGRHVRLQIRVGLVGGDDDRTLGQIVPAIMALLAGQNIVEPGMVADVNASWDKTIGPERLTLRLAEKRAPAHRTDARTRQLCRDAQHRRWAAIRATGEKVVA